MNIKGFCTDVIKYSKYYKLHINLEAEERERVWNFLVKYDGKKPLFDDTLTVNCTQTYCMVHRLPSFDNGMEVRCPAQDLKGQEVRLYVKPRKYKFKSQLDANRGELITGVSLYTTKAVAYELYKN